MKTPFMMSIAAIVLAACAAYAEPGLQPPVAVKVDHLPSHVRERVQAKADQGITALARWLELTRTVHQLRLSDVLAADDDGGAVSRRGKMSR